mgnify:CR=1 FL=1
MGHYTFSSAAAYLPRRLKMVAVPAFTVVVVVVDVLGLFGGSVACCVWGLVLLLLLLVRLCFGPTFAFVQLPAFATAAALFQKCFGKRFVGATFKTKHRIHHHPHRHQPKQHMGGQQPGFDQTHVVTALVGTNAQPQ